MAKQRQCQKCEDMKQQLDNRDDEILRLKRSLAEYEEPNGKYGLFTHLLSLVHHYI